MASERQPPKGYFIWPANVEGKPRFVTCAVVGDDGQFGHEAESEAIDACQRHMWAVFDDLAADTSNAAAAERDEARSEVERLRARVAELEAERDEARANLAESSKLWDGPESEDWIAGVRKEAAHQVARWGRAHDEGKAPPDWFWLLGWLAGKCVHAAERGDQEKALHHTISAGAVLLNWHAHLLLGSGQFRPGIADPTKYEDV